MEKAKLKTLLGALKRLLREGPARKSCGICRNAQVLSGLERDEVNSWLHTQFKAWPHFSGYDDYPIKSGDSYTGHRGAYTGHRGAYNKACAVGTLWDRDTRYGRARYQLLDFLIQRAEAALAPQRLLIDRLLAHLQAGGLNAAEANLAAKRINAGAAWIEESLTRGLRVSDFVWAGFVWGYTPEGHNYWANLAHRLERNNVR